MLIHNFILLILLALWTPEATFGELKNTQNPFQSLDQKTSSSKKASLQALIIPIHYAKSTELAQLIKLQKPSLLSHKGSILSDARTNFIWIRDTSDNLRDLKKLISKLDIPTRQVLIKARVVNVDERYFRSLGINFAQESRSTNQQGFEMDFPNYSSQVGSFKIPFAKVMNDSLIDLQLKALEEDGHASIISSPELMTHDRATASIESGEEIPYQEQTATGNTSVTFKKAVLKLKVTPTILPHNQILVQLIVNQDKISTMSVQGVPAIRTQELKTQVLLNHRETLVLGGIYEETTEIQSQKIPLLSEIPLIGYLFQQRNHLHERKKLLIFITPVLLD